MPWLEIADLAGLSAALRATIRTLARRGTLKRYAVNEKCAQAVLDFADAADASSCAHERFDADALRLVFDETLSRTVSPFVGRSPLKAAASPRRYGARSLDFDDIVVLDVNEGVLPSLRRDHPLIPADALVQLGLRRVIEDEKVCSRMLSTDCFRAHVACI